MKVIDASSGSGKWYYYEKNLQGDIVGIMNADGYKVVSYSYDAWGVPYAPVYSTDSVISAADKANAELNPFRYRGYYYDSETGYYYLQTRYYNPEWGRFINADSLINQSSPLGYNLFAYCLNSAVNMIDSGGYKPKYINDQRNDYEIDGKKMKDISFGLGNIASNGCGIIAAYNVLLSRSSRVKFNNVKNDIIWRGGLNAGGLLGVNPKALKCYMRSKFRFVHTSGPVTFLWGIKAELSESVIVLIKWGGGLEMHYIAGIGTGNDRAGGSFKFYNTGLFDERRRSIDGREMSIWTFLDYVKSNGATPIYFIGVSGKKGWW